LVALQIDPADLARLLNERKLDPDAALQSYDSIISSHVRGRAEKKQLTHEQSATLANMSKLLQDLHPELRKQFLSVAFRRISSQATSAGTEEVLGGLPDNLVIDMLKQASAEGREISPTLTGLLGKLTRAQAQSAASGGPRPGVPAEGPDAIIPPEHMEKLFNREKYEEYVTEDYEALLKRLSDGSVVSGELFPLEECAKSLEDEHLDFQIGRALVAFLEEEIDEEDYKEFAQKLVAIMPGFLQTGNFELLWDIYDTLRRHATEKPLQSIRDIAEETRKAFSGPEFIEKLLNAFEVWMKDKGQEAAGLIQALGSATIPGLLDIFSRDDSLGGRRIVLNLLCLFGEPAVSEAHKRLRDPRTHYVRNLLMFLRRAGHQTSVPYLKPLLRHRDQDVRMEALSALLKFRDPLAVNTLRDTIHSTDPDLAFKAVSLAGQYRVADVTPDILSKIKRVIVFETDYAENEEIIKALGDIGDPRAIPELEKLARATWSLYPKSLMHMKALLFESISRYPRESIAGLLGIGEKLGSDKIRQSCRKLMERK
jgi:hypothetical protein